MNKEELRAKLDEAQVKYDKRWGEKKLQEALDTYAESVAKRMNKTEKPIEEVLANVERDGEARTKNGIIIPTEVLVHHKPTKWEYRVIEKSDEADVYKYFGTLERYIRTYSKSVHGEKFAELAKQFVEKNNR